METNVTMTAEHVLLLRFLGVDHQESPPARSGTSSASSAPTAAWSLYFDGPGDLSTTVEAHVALRLLGLDASAEPVARARRFIHRPGRPGLNARLHEALAGALRPVSRGTGCRRCRPS